MSEFVVLGLGGNIGNVKETLLKAISQIEFKIGTINNVSSFYTSKAWGVTNQPDFLNCVLCVSSKLNPFKVLEESLKIELLLGLDRTSKSKWGQRTIDIDILFFENEIIQTKELVIPHPYIHKRNFVLTPLEEILPSFQHPVLGKTIRELKIQCKDELEVVKLDNL